MADVTVVIDSDGTPDPDNIGVVNIGDTVSFQADGADTVLCVAAAAIFGAQRYEIANGSAADLVVQAGAPQGPFDFYAQTGDLNADCEWRGGEEGGGEVGGGE